MISFVIPAHDEEAHVGTAVASVRDAAVRLGRPFEILVVNDQSTDRTAEVACQAGARVVDVALRQISEVRNAGARAASGELLVFVDADTCVTSEVVRASVAAFDAGAVGGGCAVRFDPPVPLYIKCLLPVALWVNRVLKTAAGCYLFARRDAFDAIGGFDREMFAGEELVFCRALKRHGRFVVLREHVVTSGRKLRTHSAREVLGVLFRLLMFGRRGVRSRTHLDLWYAQRRTDPARK
jgi:glycosyltransferase involved in cell wall biosynthesis